ncbi:hypothetical protein ACFPLB_06640 [Aquamicrobium segne]|uniref:Uncharacterized protein n=1 Tax=Aquamicrobium segne TaxID=469547 RepID=A0ABW0GVU5_9HYPH
MMLQGDIGVRLDELPGFLYKRAIAGIGFIKRKPSVGPPGA